MEIIKFLVDFYSSPCMFFLWSIPFGISVYAATRTRSPRFVLLALVCLPFMFYFFWAYTGIWSKHEVALVFNRSTQKVSATILSIFIVGLYEHYNSR